MESILITGIGGFVGHHAAEHFLKNTDCRLVGVDSWRHKGDALRLRHLLHDEAYRARMSVFTHDLTCPISDQMAEAFGPIDVILNIASESHVDRSIVDPVPFVKNNVNIALYMGELCRKLSPRMFIQCSTDEVFGPALDGYAHKEEELHLPSNPYSASKAAQEDIFFSYWRCYGIPYVRTNCMNMIGERQDSEKFIPLCMKKIMRGEKIQIHGGENQKGSRMYLHARNLADAWLHIMRTVTPNRYAESVREVVYPSAFNIVGEEELENLEVARLISGYMGKDLNFEMVDFHSARPGHDRRYALDGARMFSLGWAAPIPLRESLRRTVEWTLRPENKSWLS